MTLVYDQELPNVPGKSIRGVLVEYGPGGFSAAHTHPSAQTHSEDSQDGEIVTDWRDGSDGLSVGLG